MAAAKAVSKTSAKTSVTRRRQPHGGALNTGNPGNSGGGRTSDAFKAMCRRLASQETTLAAVRQILGNVDHPMFMSALNWATNHGYGKAKERHEHSGPGGGPINHGFTIRWGDQEVTF